MNHDENTDSTLTLELRDAMSALATPGRPPLAAITTRGRSRQRRRAGLAGLGAAGAVAGTVLALNLAGVLGAAPARSTGTIGTAAPTPGATIQAAAFTLTSNANGTDTLTLKMSQMLDPAALQRALRQHGIPALVKTDTYCSSSPAAPDPASIGVLSVRPPFKPHGLVPAPAGAAPSTLKQIAARTVTVINPAAIPARTELFFDYASGDRLLFAGLIYTDSYACSTGQPPAAP
jgi:hypothetical protein